jgi:hypothetical protein
MSDGRQVMFPVAGIPGMYHFWCEGCDTAHAINSGWTFDGDLIEPTITPSVLSTGQLRCHSFVTKGRIIYLSDCNHALAGKTVRMVPLPWLSKASPSS